MYLAAVGGTYFFGLHLGLLAVGAYIGLAMTSASGLSVWCCAGRAESGRIRDWLIRANKIKLHYKKEPVTLVPFFIYFIIQAPEACIPPFASLFQILQTAYSVSLLKSHYIPVTKYLKYMKTPTIITLIIEKCFYISS